MRESKKQPAKKPPHHHHLSESGGSHHLRRTWAVATFAHCKSSPQPTMTSRSTDGASASVE